MPHYEIHHECPLAEPQIDAFASALTELHCRLFSAPSIFVNVTFHYTCTGKNPGQATMLPNLQHTRVGGRKAATNYIIGHLRPRGADNREKLNTLVQEITKIWNQHTRAKPKESLLSPGQGKIPKDSKFHIGKSKTQKVHEANEELSRKSVGRLDDKRALHNVFIMEDIVAGAEQGFVLPVAGQDAKWVEDNMSKFEERARDGDDSMKALLQEIKNGLGTGPVAKSKL